MKLFITHSNIAHLEQDCPYLRPGTKYDIVEFEREASFLAALHWTQICKMCKDPKALGEKRTNWTQQRMLPGVKRG